MNIDNLEVGITYKNYRTICRVLEEDEKTSDSKIAQLKEWNRFFKWEQIGRAFKILEIIDMVFPKQKIKRKKNSKYSEILYPIIINMLYGESLKNSSDFPLIVDKKYNLFDMLGFSNHLYAELKLNSESEKLILDEFRDNCREIINQVFMRTLKNLHKTERINYQEQYYINYNYEKKGKDEDFDTKPHLADPEQSKLINLQMKLISIDLKCETQYQIYTKFLYSEFCKRINERLKVHGFSYVSTGLRLSLFLSETANTTISQRYGKIFEGMSAEQVKNHIHTLKLQLNYLIIKQIKSRNLKEKERLIDNNNFLGEQTIPTNSLILDALIKENENQDKLTIQEYAQIYYQRREDLINRIIKIA